MQIRKLTFATIDYTALLASSRPGAAELGF